jgi:hypothetical protein
MAVEPKEFGKYYWHVLTYPSKPKVIWEKAETQEIDEPFRFGSGWAIRAPFTRKALVIGKWKKSYSESEALTYAIRGRSMGSDEVDWDAVRFGVSRATDDKTETTS